MKTWTKAVVVGAVVMIAGQIFGAEARTNEVLTVMLDLADGSRVVGAPGIEAVPVQTAYAKMALSLKKIRSVRFADDHETASFELEKGDKITGVVTLGPIPLTTLFGKVAIPITQIRVLQVSVTGGAFARPGLVLWNRLGSEFEVTQGGVGPGGKLNAGRFVEGRFGNGIELTMSEPFGVTFPPEIIPGPDGCIEFWAKLVGFQAALPWGDKPALIAACSESGSHDFLLHFNGNDGAANGGLCARVAGLASAGTGQYGNWTYARAMGSDEVAAWHHYALVWATDGIKGVDNGTRKAAVYVDGKLNTGVWNGGTGNALAVPTKGKFGLLAHQGMPSCSIVFDNLKIWSYAKTDFSDRTEE